MIVLVEQQKESHEIPQLAYYKTEEFSYSKCYIYIQLYNEDENERSSQFLYYTCRYRQYRLHSKIPLEGAGL